MGLVIMDVLVLMVLIMDSLLEVLIMDIQTTLQIMVLLLIVLGVVPLIVQEMDLALRMLDVLHSCSNKKIREKGE